MVKKHWNPYHILINKFLFLAGFLRKFIICCFYKQSKRYFKSTNKANACFNNITYKISVDYNIQNHFCNKDYFFKRHFNSCNSNQYLHNYLMCNSLNVLVFSYSLKLSKIQYEDLVNREQFGYVPDHQF